MSRLLHAAARGARIGWQTFSGKWHPALSLNGVQSEFGQDAYRIHPADEHLQYGPISTALREEAKSENLRTSGVFLRHELFNFAYKESDFLACYTQCNPEHRSLFLLILAEALADEGL